LAGEVVELGNVNDLAELRRGGWLALDLDRGMRRLRPIDIAASV
jgi:hypothetical protein